MLSNLIRQFYYKNNFSEITHIKNSNKKIYYIIRRKPPGAGFFSNYFYALSHIKYAISKGYEIVVDMENYPTFYSEKEDLFGTKNAWEYYFSQPNCNNLAEAYNSNNFILSRNEYLEDEGVPTFQINQGHITKNMVKDLYPICKKLIPIKDEIMLESDRWFTDNVNGCSCIGVHVRGTDMKNALPYHTLPPSIEKITLQINEILIHDENAKIFLSSDESSALEYLKMKYGNRLFFIHAYRSLEGNIGIHNQKSTRKNHHYLLGKEVLMDSLMLSKCDYLICGISNVTSAAVLFSNDSYKKEIVLK